MGGEGGDEGGGGVDGKGMEWMGGGGGGTRQRDSRLRSVAVVAIETNKQSINIILYI